MSNPRSHSTGRPGVALAVANARYWTSVAPLARAQLRRWERRARAIPDPALRALALAKLRDERFNAEVAATLATLAPRARRARTVEAIVALQVLYDYLDGLTEQPAPDPLQSGRRLSRAFTDAIGGELARGGASASGEHPLAAASSPPRDYFQDRACDDGGYLAALSKATRAALAGLGAWSAVAATARAAAARCAEAQVRVHAAPRAGGAQLEQWAREQAAGTGLQWREFLGGAVSSVLAIHALIAAAASDRTTPGEATAIDCAYLSISALSTMLDGVVDHERDSARGEAWYMDLYDSRALLAEQVVAVAADARRRAQALPEGAHHTITLVGVVAYYTSAPQARRGIAAPLTRRVNRELGPLLAPTLAVMRAWRGAKALRGALSGERRAGERQDGKRRTTPASDVSVEGQTPALHHGLTATTRPT
jgi:tetraprenyl-beta-curcumene synthase